MNNNSNTDDSSADWLMSAVKKNPEGLLLLAAGCALLFRTRSSRSRQWSHGYQSYPSGQGQHGPRMEHRGSGGQDWAMPEGMSRAADTAREYASNVGKTVSDTARSYASAAGEYADQARQTVGETARSYASAAGEYADHARQTIRDQSGSDCGANAEHDRADRSGAAIGSCHRRGSGRRGPCSCFPIHPNGTRNARPRRKTTVGSGYQCW